jgi:peptidoglycan hydrolase-like protein with peptidoglycan-binding domain
LQQALKDKGFDPGPVDGIEGPMTVSALKGYQKSENVTMTGELDLATAEKLGMRTGRVPITESVRSRPLEAPRMGTPWRKALTAAAHRSPERPGYRQVGRTRLAHSTSRMGTWRSSARLPPLCMIGGLPSSGPSSGSWQPGVSCS